MERWFEEALSVSYAEIIRDFGFPAAETSARFHRPIAVGEEVDIQLSVERLGSSSLRLYFSVHSQGIQKAEGMVQTVCIAVQEGGFRFSSAKLPADLRLRMQEFLISTES